MVGLFEGKNLAHTKGVCVEGASLQLEEGLCFKNPCDLFPFDLSFPTLSLFRFVFIWKRVGRRRRR